MLGTQPIPILLMDPPSIRFLQESIGKVFKDMDVNVEFISAPPISLPSYRLQHGLFSYTATLDQELTDEDEYGRQWWVFSDSQNLTGKYESTSVLISPDGYMEEYDDSGGGCVTWYFEHLVAILCVHYLIQAFLADTKPRLYKYHVGRRSLERALFDRHKPKSKNRYTRIALCRFINECKDAAHTPNSRKRCEYRFGVRGHWRHYKDGKTVFVKAYEKNKTAAVYKQQIYTLPKRGGDAQ